MDTVTLFDFIDDLRHAIESDMRTNGSLAPLETIKTVRRLEEKALEEVDREAHAVMLDRMMCHDRTENGTDEPVRIHPEVEYDPNDIDPFEMSKAITDPGHW